MKRVGFPVFALILGVPGCGFPTLRPEADWPAEVRGLAATEVDIRWEYDLKVWKPELRGCGVIVHSSPERGTYVLTNWHVACQPRNYTDLPEGAHASGPVGGEVTVRVHRNAFAGNAPPEEWTEYPAKVVLGRMKVISKASLENVQKVFSELYLDVALLELKTGREPLKSARIAERGPEPGGRGTVRGIHSRTGAPYSREVLFASESAFLRDGLRASGSGVYNGQGELLGLFCGERRVRHGYVLPGGSEPRIEFDNIYYFVPMKVARPELETAGYGFLFGR